MKTKILGLSIGIIILICIVNVSASLPTQNEAVRIANSHLEFEKQSWEQSPEQFFPPSSYLGTPMLIRNIEGEEAYWVIPVCKGTQVIGTFKITNNICPIIQRASEITRYDIPQNRYPEISLYEANTIINNIANEKYNNVSVSEPRYIYSKLGETWMCDMYKENNNFSIIYLNPHCLNRKYILYEQTEKGIESLGIFDIE